MKKLLLLVLTMTAACFAARAAITVGTGGSAVESFAARPPAADWATFSITGTDAGVGNAAALDAAVQNVAATSITAQVNDGGVANPVGQNALAAWTAGGTAYVQTRPTGNNATLLMATLFNDTGAAATALTISYTLAQSATTPAEQVPGHQVYVSVTGAAGSWVNVASLSGGTVGAKSATVSLPGSWPNGSTMYVLWADDNATGGADRAYQIDDVSFSASSAPIPLSVTLTAPAANQVFTTASNSAEVQLTAVTDGSVPATSVSFFVNGSLAATDPSAPFAVTVPLPFGSHTVYARAANASETAFSVTNTIFVRAEFASLVGSTYQQNFDGMAPDGTFTPVGWYVGSTLPANVTSVTPGDGSAGANAAIHGWNYGTVGEIDRALGTAPTGNDRHIVLRLRNDTPDSIVGLTIQYDGEVWRNYTNVAASITNFVSFDLGATWIPTLADFSQPFAPINPQGAVNGNDPANRVAGIEGSVTAPNPVPPGGVIYIRWFDDNDAGTDGGLAVDEVSILPEFDTFQPFVVITSPTNGATFAEGANITINANAAMQNPITNVAFFRNGVLVGNDTAAPYSSIFSNAAAGVYNLTAVASDSAGNNLSTATPVQITVNPNQAPTVTVTNPTETSYLVGANITNGVIVADADGTVVRVHFYVDGTLSYTDTNAPFKFEYGSALAGPHTVAAIAVDNLGLGGSNAISFTVTNPPGVTLLVTNGSIWKYLDAAPEPAANWMTAGFDDSTWLSGQAEIGFGDMGQDRPERTVARRVVGGVTNITLYFRHTFNVANPAALSGLIVNLQRDDGGIVYINGTEVFRSNIPDGPVTGTTTASGVTPDDGAGYFSTNLSASVLQAGANLIAVEVHQDSPTSSDISFDLMLWGVGGAGPRLSITPISATQAEIAWPDSFTGYTLQFKNEIDAASWGTEPATVTQSGGFFRATVNTTGGKRFWRLEKP